jgi:transcriptional regulator GlxA family with amidase domain
MRFMWDHLDADLSVDEIAQEVALSRRQLERRFHACLGRGINAELRRKRLERCCELLRSTDLTVIDIAPMIGFGSDVYLHQAFKRVYGMSPVKYRKKQKHQD